MIINHNMNALNAHRNMTANTNSAGKSMEKLSSGLRINRAGDDAAGLAISEKMRGQIRGLDQASRNAQDGISLIQTAEGALNETHNILQRMRELAVQSANDTNITEDRAAIQEEINALTQEIDRISEQTEFNKQTLLDGSFNGTFQIGANANQTINLEINSMNSSKLGLTSNVTVTETVAGAAGGGALLKDGEYTIKDNKVFDVDGKQVGVYDSTAKKVTAADGKASYTFTTGIEDGGKFTVSGTGANASQEVKKDVTGTLKNLAPGEYSIEGTNILRDGKKVGTIDSTTKITKFEVDGKEISVDELKTFGILKDNTGSAVVADSKFSVNGTDVSSSVKASGSIETINKAIENVSTQRAKLGAVQNRLEHTTANLNNTSENLTAAESRVRDVDMAKEMMTFSKNNILSQAAQAMLAQANQQPQGVLQLLR
ncbi:flagellin [Clostridium paraputrificum]|uniref:Flagellin n=1 Tax=Clostridium paraputrificum TaxID=29363 RepID=A0A1B8RTR5_9CLOT|nr:MULTISPECIES: flagellin [Clostridium]MDB2088720.1 flagellin [Clostridium paraputrificum]MDB2095161.1 flagellin [Clostridium paraputrificum]MDU1178675.1 flagellin [Clostridium sp.]MDU1225673.1 flagellin [Clostridium sp.]MDU1823046.1 flagellin [Clostridium sp.]